MKNSIIIKKIEDEKFVMIDGENEISIKYDVKEEKIKKDGEIIKINHWLLLPENSINRKGFRLEDFKDKIEIEYFERKTPEFSKSENKKEEFKREDFLTEEEKKIIEDINKKIDKRIEEEKKKRENPEYIKLLKLKNEFENIFNNDLIPEEMKEEIRKSEKYLKLLQMIKDFK